MTPYRYLLAIDPSLTCTGWALFRVVDECIVAVGEIKALGPEYLFPKRLQELQQRIVQLFEKSKLNSNDVLITEAPTTIKDPHSTFKVEQVRCIFETIARSKMVLVPGRINPRSIHHEILGMRGRQLERAYIKEMALRTVLSLYGGQLKRLGFILDEKHLTKHQDIVDALLVGRLSLIRLKQAAEAGMMPEEFFQEQRSPRPRRVHG